MPTLATDGAPPASTSAGASSTPPPASSSSVYPIPESPSVPDPPCSSWAPDYYMYSTALASDLIGSACCTFDCSARSCDRARSPGTKSSIVGWLPPHPRLLHRRDVAFDPTADLDSARAVERGRPCRRWRQTARLQPPHPPARPARRHRPPLRRSILYRNPPPCRIRHALRGRRTTICTPPRSPPI